MRGKRPAVAGLGGTGWKNVPRLNPLCPKAFQVVRDCGTCGTAYTPYYLGSKKRTKIVSFWVCATRVRKLVFSVPHVPHMAQTLGAQGIPRGTNCPAGSRTSRNYELL